MESETTRPIQQRLEEAPSNFTFKAASNEIVDEPDSFKLENERINEESPIDNTPTIGPQATTLGKPFS